MARLTFNLAKNPVPATGKLLAKHATIRKFNFAKVREISQARKKAAKHAEALAKQGATSVPKLRTLSQKERQKRSSLTFREYVDRVNPRYIWYRHCIILAAILQKVADGEIKRLMVFMPPRHGKSEEITRLFASYYVYRNPDRFVGLASYSDELARTLSHAARDNYTLAGGELRADSHAVKHWSTPYGGGLWATGVGGPATGKGYHLGIIDDPLKNPEDAGSSVKRQKQKEWWDSVWSTRDEPDAAQIVVQTRWHEDDLSGYLLSLENQAIALSQEDPDEAQLAEHEGWYIINFPAICEEPEERVTFPATCTVEPEFRSPGAALCPERYPLKKLLRRKRSMLAYYWNAIFQQRPKAIEGNKFKRTHFSQLIDACPYSPEVQRVRYWDIASSSSKRADYTVGVRLSIYRHIVTIEDVVRFRKAPNDRNAEIRDTCRRDEEECGYKVRTYVEWAPGMAAEAIQQIIEHCIGYPVEDDHPQGDKTSRAEPFQTYCEAGNVRMKNAPWNADYIEEMIAFDNAPHDDQVDATSGAFKKLTAENQSVEFSWI